MTKRKQQTSSTAHTRAEQPAVSGSQPAKGSRLGKVPVSKRAKSEQSPSPSSPKGLNAQTAAAEDVDIDNIFKQARAKKQVAAKPDKKAKTVGKPAPVVGNKDDLFGTGQPRQRRYDAEGLPVYTADELNVGAGGDTDQCPFDCTCCF